MDPLKQRIMEYWSRRADSFCDQRMRELVDPKRERWLAELQRYLPKDGGRLRVLDLGTGTGYFAFLFAADGHDVVGIDLTAHMIEKAREASETLGLPVDFRVMDAEHPDFEEESFDVLVTRNLTWTLPHLPAAYHEWYHLLKPGGVLINFDADYANYAELNDPDNLPENHAHKNIPRDMSEENDEITMEVAAYQQPRPQWDVQLLLRAGFEQVHVDNGIWKRIYAEIDEFYNPTPIFTLVAYKAEK